MLPAVDDHIPRLHRTTVVLGRGSWRFVPKEKYFDSAFSEHLFFVFTGTREGFGTQTFSFAAFDFCLDNTFTYPPSLQLGDSDGDLHVNLEGGLG